MPKVNDHHMVIPLEADVSLAFLVTHIHGTTPKSTDDREVINLIARMEWVS